MTMRAGQSEIGPAMKQCDQVSTVGSDSVGKVASLGLRMLRAGLFMMNGPQSRAPAGAFVILPAHPLGGPVLAPAGCDIQRV